MILLLLPGQYIRCRTGQSRHGFGADKPMNDLVDSKCHLAIDHQSRVLTVDRGHVPRRHQYQIRSHQQSHRQNRAY